MNNSLLRSLMLLATVACSVQVAGAHAGTGSTFWSGRLLAQSATGAATRITMGDAMQIVQRSAGGRVLNAQEARQDGRDGYRIKVLTASGEVRIFFVDAGSGAMRQD